MMLSRTVTINKHCYNNKITKTTTTNSDCFNINNKPQKFFFGNFF